PVQQLSLKIAEIDDVEVDDADASNTRGGEVHRGRGPEPAGADAAHATSLETPLPVHADLGHEQVAAVALDFLRRKRRQFHFSLRNHLVLFSSEPGQAARSGLSPTTGDAGHDAERVARLDRRLFLLQV